MRGTRALVGSLGAGFSLAIAGSLALLVVSTVVAFRGWPDDLGSSSPVSVSHLGPAAEKANPRSLPSAPAPVLVVPAVASTPGARRDAATRTSTSGGARGTSSPSTSTSVPATSTPGAPSLSSSPAPSQQATGQVTPTVKRTTSTAGQTVRDTTKQVGATVAPVSPTVGKVVQDVGSTAGDAVDKGGSAVAEALGSVGH